MRFVIVYPLVLAAGVFTPAEAQTSCDPLLNPGLPCFTPYTAKPTVRNRPDVARLLARHYPAELKSAGVGGVALMWILIDADGVVRNVQLKQSSGIKKLDEAALLVARDLVFEPATNRGVPVPVWIQLPITFCTNCRPK
jgi:periplasmic protein TonB